jgi:rhodanese-related sulfurtransferase
MTMFGHEDVGVEKLHDRIASGDDIQIVDVREDWEWAGGHIAGAMHIPLDDLPARLSEIDPERDAAFVCHLGGRSEMAARFARGHGLWRALNVAGGMDAWIARGYEVE